MQAQHKRRPELDSLRGIAALSVLLQHALNVIPEFGGGGESTLLSILTLGPLHLAWAGHQAVVLFFVLSGFVLSIPFYEKPQGTFAFLIKRVCRICIPYWSAVCISFLAFVFFKSAEIPYLSDWFSNTWRNPISSSVILQHVLLVGNFNNGEYNPALWSLVLEMRISLLFPVIMLAVNQLRWQVSLFGVGIGCYCIGRAGQWYSLHVAESPNDYWSTLMYIYVFIAGALLAKYAQALGDRWRMLTAKQRIYTFGIALMMYDYTSWCPDEWRTTANRLLGDLPTVGAVCVFILAALNSKRASSPLLNPTVILLGKVSYSFYLLHGIVLLSLIHALHKYWPLPLILVTVIPVSMLLATASFYAIEKPSIYLGRHLAKMF